MAISEWRAEDMEELDEYRLAEDLESMPSNLTELGRDGEAYNMRYMHRGSHRMHRLVGATTNLHGPWKWSNGNAALYMDAAIQAPIIVTLTLGP